MNNLPIVVRLTAAALAVFVTTSTLNGMISIAEPQQSQLMAQGAARHAARVAQNALHQSMIVAQASSATTAD